MANKTPQPQSQSVEKINIVEMLNALLKNWIWILLATVVLSLGYGIYRQKTQQPTYTASVLMYVNNSSYSSAVDSLTSKLDSSIMSSSEKYVNTYLVILKSRVTLEEVAARAGVPYSAGVLSNMISGASVNNTAVFRIMVTGYVPEEVYRIANTISEVLPEKIGNIINGTSCRVVDSAVLPIYRSGPNYVQNYEIGALAGFVLAAGIIILLQLFNNEITSSDWLLTSFQEKIPLLSVIPNHSQKSKKYYHRYYSKHYGASYTQEVQSDKDKTKQKNGTEPSNVLNNGYAVREAYNLLRTNLLFAIRDMETAGAKVIGITSSIPGEGKSSASINTAYSLSETGAKVLLMECDLRRPSIASYTGIEKSEGLAEFLADGKAPVIRHGVLTETLDVILCGEIPLNPAILLGSERLEKALHTFRQHYDYIIIDLPPVLNLPDALTVSKNLDGMMLVVRHMYVHKNDISEAVRQLEYVQAKIIGFVYNDYMDSAISYYRHSYGKSKKYYKYGRYGGYSYGYGDDKDGKDKDSNKKRST